MITPRVERDQWATQSARDGALARGFDLSRAAWRNVFLAITDTMAGDGHRSSNPHITAAYLGPVRQGERWAVVCHGRRFDVLYAPKIPVILGMTDPRAGAGV